MYGNGAPDPMLPPGSGACQCTACGLYFRSVSGFDAHRTGEPGKGRRCKTPLEMAADGMSTNERGQWITEVYTREDGAA